MPPPKAIVCHLCNGKYFSRSWPIHLKACEAKWKKTHSRCEYCGVAVNNADWSDHRAHCKPSRKKKLSKQTLDAPLVVPQSVDSQQIPASKSNKVIECEECEAEDAMWRCQQCEQSLCAMCDSQLHRKGARARHIRDPLSAKALRAENLSNGVTDSISNEKCPIIGTLNPPAAAAKVDGRTECKFCHRKFNPQRAEKHMRICSKASQKMSKRKVYDGAKKRLEGTEFLQYQYNRSSTPEQVKQWKKEGRRWKEESNMLRQGAGGMALDLVKLKESVAKRMKFRLQGYGRNGAGEAKDEEAMDQTVDQHADIQVIQHEDEKLDESHDGMNGRNSVNSGSSGAIQKRERPQMKQKRVFKQKVSAHSRSDAPSSGRSDRGISGISGVSARGSKSTASVGKRSMDKSNGRNTGNTRNTRNTKMPLTGASMKMRQRPSSNTSSNSITSKGSGRFSRRPIKKNVSSTNAKTMDTKGLNVKGKETTSTRVQRQKKKPGIPKFERKRSTTDVRNDAKQSKVGVSKPTFGVRTRNPKSSDPPQPRNVRSMDPVQPRVERVQQRENVNKVQKENDGKAQQPKIQRAKSEAKSLPRGIDLGVNVKKIKGNGPKSMDDYLERERARRQQRGGMARNQVKNTMIRGDAAGGRRKKTSQMGTVTKKMSRLQIEQQKIDRQKSLQKITKPTGSKDLASKRAAYFESLLQHQDE